MDMNEILLLKNPVQNYAWGSREAIASLLGQTAPSELPQAELWMGAHPKAPSLVVSSDGHQPLDVLVAGHAETILGASVCRRFNSRFPYLFKVLAAAEPLSIQAHPDKSQADAGFLRETRAGIPLDAPQRNYRDDNHKPEIICALTPFWGLKGFRKVPDTVKLVTPVMTGELEPLVRKLEAAPDTGGIKQFFHALMTLGTDERQRITAGVVEKARLHEEKDAAYQWIPKLHKAYPGDIGILSPLFLNLICLKPGDAMFLPAGELHAYLDGTGIELMANSDNVLRGGLTPKHVDLDELLSVLRFESIDVEIRHPEEVRACERAYVTDAEEFTLSVIEVSDSRTYRSPGKRGPEILLCTQGEAKIRTNGQVMTLDKGKTVLVPAKTSSYVISGNAVFYKAGVPESVLD